MRRGRKKASLILQPDESRRRFLQASVGLAGASLLGRHGLVTATEELSQPFVNGVRPLRSYPQKRPLPVLTSRPLQLETPFEVFNEGVFTPNDAFFVRWHLADMPTSVNTAAFKLTIRGRVKRSISLSLAELERHFEPVELAAVCQCSGNSRSRFEPRIPGGQWADGAMGNALWRGIRLKELLTKAGLEADAVQVRFSGLDGPVMPTTPDFMKSLDIDHALNEDVLVAYAMNGEPLPLLNGYPLRLVVPGWYATYWVKMLSDIEVINQEDQNFWMKTAYRIPADPCACVAPGQKPRQTLPINRMTVRSFITSVRDGDTVTGGQRYTVKGIAFDGGYGISRVLFSSDGGHQWREARLGKNHGKYSFRAWEAPFTPLQGNHYALQALAINQIGESQRKTPRWNPGGYLRNVVETVNINAV